MPLYIHRFGESHHNSQIPGGDAGLPLDLAVVMTSARLNGTFGIRTLQDPWYAALVTEQHRLEAELASRSCKTGKVFFEGGNELRMRRLDFLARSVEEPANATEIEIWRELARGLRQQVR